MKQTSRTFLDWMIIFDSALCLLNVQSILTIGFRLKNICFISIFSAFALNLLNRLLTVAIVAYRYVFVLMSMRVQTQAQRSFFSSALVLFILVLSLVTTLGAVYYRDYFRQFLCKLKIFVTKIGKSCLQLTYSVP